MQFIPSKAKNKIYKFKNSDLISSKTKLTQNKYADKLLTEFISSVNTNIR